MCMLAFLALSGCKMAIQCEEGTIRSGDRCVDYVAGEPVVPDSPVLALASGVSWQWQITGTVDLSHDVAVYDVDLFDLTDEVRQGLLDRDRSLVCYFSAGSYEGWRPDAALFPADAIGKTLDGWEDERWLDHTRDDVRQLMLARLDLAVEKGCEAVEPDNVTAHDTRSGFRINRTEQLDYNRFLADAAHERGLSIALKNDTEQISQLEPWFDFAVNEECAFYDECGTNRPFVDANKAVLNAEYVDDFADAASLATEVCGFPGLSTIVKTWDLGAPRQGCAD